MDFEFELPTKVVAKKGVSNKVGEYFYDLAIHKVLVVTDKGVKKAGLLNNIYISLRKKGIAFDEYDGVKPNPRDIDCNNAAKEFSARNIEGILAIGGGSTIDTAKAISILLSNGGKVRDYEGLNAAQNNPVPIIAIPTTTGTGSEVTLWSIITDTARNYKMPIGDIRIAPKIALLDVELTATMPSHIIASTGMDALTHAIESYTCRVATPVTDGLALHAMKLISENLFEAVFEKENEQARENMLVGSMIAGISFGNADTASVHCLSEAIGALYDTPHGIANSIFLPYCFRYNIDANPKKHADIAYALGIPFSVPQLEAAHQAVDLLFKYNERLGIPSFNEIDKVDPNDFSELARKCVMNLGNVDNVRSMTEEDYETILNEAYKVVV